jgi:hypothetical protein
MTALPTSKEGDHEVMLRQIFVCGRHVQEFSSCGGPYRPIIYPVETLIPSRGTPKAAIGADGGVLYS